MTRLLIILIFLSSSSISFAQQIQVGKTIKTSYEDYAIQLHRDFVKDSKGNLYSGVLYNHKKKGESFVEKFDENLNIIEAKPIGFSEKNISKMLKFFMQNDKLYSINLEEEKSKNNLYLYEIDKNTLNSKRRETVLSSNKTYTFRRYYQCKVSVSENNKRVAAFALSKEKGGKLGLVATLYGENMRKEWETTTLLPSKAANNDGYSFEKIYIDEETDNMYVIIEDGDEKSYLLCTFSYKDKKASYEKIDIKKDAKNYITNISISKLNNRTKWLMFISEKQFKNVETLRIVVTESTESISVSIGKNIIENKKDKRLSFLKFRNIFTYPDGSMTITSEPKYEYSEKLFDKEISKTESESIYVVNINKENKVSWENIINKDQNIRSYSDIFLSFTSMNDNENNIYIFFVNGISDASLNYLARDNFTKITGITNYVIDKDGKILTGEYIPRDEKVSEFPPIFMPNNTSKIEENEYILLESSPKYNTQRMVKIKLLKK